MNSSWLNGWWNIKFGCTWSWKFPRRIPGIFPLTTLCTGYTSLYSLFFSAQKVRWLEDDKLRICLIIKKKVLDRSYQFSDTRYITSITIWKWLLCKYLQLALSFWISMKTSTVQRRLITWNLHTFSQEDCARQIVFSGPGLQI